MRIVRNIHDFDQVGKRLFVTLGNFDGIHLGHQKILKELRRRSIADKGQSVVITFDPHPRRVLDPGSQLQLLISMNHRLRLLEEFEIDHVLIFHFDHEFSKMNPDFFIRDLLFSRLHFSELIVGKNYAFGKDRKGDASLLRRLGLELGFEIDFVEPVKVDGEFVSSSLLRSLVLQGNLERVSKLLNRSYSIRGPVIKGQQMGAEMGFRTANLALEGIILPPRGVYAVQVSLNKELFWGLANIGVRPTFKQTVVLNQVEVHILDFQREIYGAEIELLFIERIRDEIQFESIQALCARIKQDCAHVFSKFIHR